MIQLKSKDRLWRIPSFCGKAVFCSIHAFHSLNEVYPPSVQFSCSVVFDSLQPHEPQHTRPPCPSPTPKLMSIESVVPSNYLILCPPLLLLPSIFPSIRVFSSESALCISWPKCWCFSFSISPSNEHPGLISFRMDWLDLLAVSPRDSQESSPT